MPAPRFLPPRSLGAALLGAACCAAACGCGAAELAATEDPAPAAAPSPGDKPAAARALPRDARPADPAAPAPVGPTDWDFFGPPTVAEKADEAGPAAERLHLRGFIQKTGGPRLALLWVERAGGAGELMPLGAGQSRGGVTVVELGEDRVTVEAPDRVALQLPKLGAGTGGAAPRGVARPAARPPVRRTARPRVGPPVRAVRPAAETASAGRPTPAERFAPPPPPPPPPVRRPPVERGDDED